MSAVRYGILHGAIDPSPLWELTWRSTVAEAHGTRVVQPSRTIDEVRTELIVLLAEGRVELYDRDSSVSSALEPVAAAAIVEDDGNWVVPAESGRQTVDVVVVTDSGVEEYQRLLATRG
jgi:hypothetical protein